ncbi:MAG: helix-turn-helix transcriptional regulator [Rhodopseudomonas palustris]|uniref:histidine kinase n=1 Tax=Rhodopseudomonas palustris TaxID=1076 RepID=A0A933RXW2_RHOPL|nr:helix-turn-helix transcriptional regulator [Rhodopseudomonas palustris]
MNKPTLSNRSDSSPAEDVDRTQQHDRGLAPDAEHAAANPKEVGVAIAHQLAAPLTALLLNINELKRLAQDTDDVTCESRTLVIDRALDEAERLSEIVESFNRFERPREPELAVAIGYEILRWLKDASAGDCKGQLDLSRFRKLTMREQQVLELVATGCSSKEGAIRMDISPRTFEAHRAQIMRKLGVRTAAQLIRLALSER